MLREDPRIAQNSPARLREIVLSHGVEDIPEIERWLGVSKRYPDLMDYLGTGAAALSTGKQPVVFVGPLASGKSTAVTILKR